MGNQSQEARRRSITLKVRVSPEERAVIEAHARAARRSISAFMRERSLGMYTGDQVLRIVRADLRRMALSLHRLAHVAGDEQDASMDRLLERAMEEVTRLLGSLSDEAG